MTQQESVKQSNDTSRRARRMNRRQQDIFTVAARLFAERGYERTTLDMIADELGLSKPSLYYYVKSKEDVLAHIFQKIFQSILERVQTDVSPEMSPEVRLYRLILTYVTHACIYPEGRTLFLYESYLLSVCNPELLTLRDRYQRQIEDAISAGVKQGVFHVSHAKLAALAIVGALHAIPLWYVPDGPLSPTEIGEYYARILIGGLAAPLDLPHGESPFPTT
jgi:TetR/AcrR family transcriptional regulator, cholesterol catabolism regulator